VPQAGGVGQRCPEPPGVAVVLLPLELFGRDDAERHSPFERGGGADDSRAKLRPVVSVRVLQPSEVAYVDDRLPLSRLDQEAEGSSYLIAWEDGEPVGHAHLAWEGTRLGVPEVQDVYVLPECRSRGIATLLNEEAEQEVRARGWNSISLSVSKDGNPVARRLYERLGYVDAGLDPVRVSGTIMLRGRPFEVDDTLVYLTKPL
jgi:GNAT superfamily N-acetyltransferase